MQEYLTPDEIAIRLKMSKRSVQRLIAKGRLAAVNVGTADRKNVRVSMEQLLRFLKELKEKEDQE